MSPHTPDLGTARSPEASLLDKDGTECQDDIASLIFSLSQWERDCLLFQLCALDRLAITQILPDQIEPGSSGSNGEAEKAAPSPTIDTAIEQQDPTNPKNVTKNDVECPLRLPHNHSTITTTTRSDWPALLRQLHNAAREVKDKSLVGCMVDDPDHYHYPLLIDFSQRLQIGIVDTYRITYEDTSMDSDSYASLLPADVKANEVDRFQQIVLDRYAARKRFETRTGALRVQATYAIRERALGGDKGWAKGRLSNSGGLGPWRRPTFGGGSIEIEAGLLDDLVHQAKVFAFYPLEGLSGTDKDITECWMEDMIIRTIKDIANGPISPIAQDDLQSSVARVRSAITLADALVQTNNLFLFKTNRSVIRQLTHVISGVLAPMPYSAAELLRLDFDVVFAICRVEAKLSQVGMGEEWTSVMADLGKYTPYCDDSSSSSEEGDIRNAESNEVESKALDSAPDRNVSSE